MTEVARTGRDPAGLDPAGRDAAVEEALERHRRELTAHCYRMLGSSFEAEDAVQETLVRAWRAYDGFEGRAQLRSWLYRIATNVCLDMLNGRNRRARPMDLHGPSSADTPVGATRPESEWVLPVADSRVLATDADPAELAEARETIRLAFVAALQHLPPRQRAVLLLRDVVRWHAGEVAELLGTTDASVNSALQRARATIATSNITDSDPVLPMDSAQEDLLDRYVDAFERYDMDSLTSLIHEDATQSMPPIEMWLRGRDQILTFWQTQGIGCAGSRLLPTVANGRPAFGQYRPDAGGDGHRPWALQVLEIADGQVVELSCFLDTALLFPQFGLPSHLGPEPASGPTTAAASSG